MKLEFKDYQGSPSTLCVGCGHDSISKHIITACYQSGIAPWQVAKMSGIGCSSKLPAYFMSGSFAFNSMHGRMAPVATGALVANKELLYLGISGDGDSGNIGIGGFIHLIRRNAPVVYIIANNGVFGLTKGQFSAAADEGSLSKSGQCATLPSLDFCAMAIEAGCGFVARSFSGDGKQLVPLLQAAFRHQGTALIEIVSPCITFNNHEGSTKSYDYVKEHDLPLQAAGSHDVHDAIQALAHLQTARLSGKILTGLFYQNENRPSVIDDLNLTATPLCELQEAELRPTAEELLELQKEYS